MPTLDIGGHTVGYDITGDGPDLVAIQGLGFARWGWDWQVPDLSRDFRVITFDNRGIGESPDPFGPRSVEQLADDTLRFMDALGIERAHVMGASGGGFIAIEMALSAPSRVDRLVLATTAGTGDWSILGKPTVEIFNALGIGPDPDPDPSLTDEERVLRFTRNMFSDAYGAAHPEMLQRIIDLRAQTAQPPACWLAHFQANLRFDRRDRLGEISSPTLVLHGDEDRVVEPAEGEALARAIPNARLQTLPGGHVFLLEQAALFNEAVTRFLSEDR